MVKQLNLDEIFDDFYQKREKLLNDDACRLCDVTLQPYWSSGS